MPDVAIARTMPSYADAVAQFRIEAAAAHLHGDLARGLNACVECCDRHAASGATALDWIDINGRQHSFSFAQMQALSARVANLLVAQGVKPGDVVAGLLPRTPELVATILGTWRAGAVYQPLFTAFGPKAIEHRLHMSEARLVVTNIANRAKLDEIAEIGRAHV